MWCLQLVHIAIIKYHGFQDDEGRFKVEPLAEPFHGSKEKNVMH
jgi:hypothetical protein